MDSKTRSETIAEVLLARILEGFVLPGERLVESALAAELDVSQNTVRDALALLERDGWTIKIARRGAFVRSFNRAEAGEVYRLLEAIEGVAVGYLVGRAKRHLGTLEAHLNDAYSAVRIGALVRAVDAIFGFHATIGRACGQKQTAALLQRLLNQARLLETMRLVRAPRPMPDQIRALDAHQPLLGAIAEGDNPAAQAALHAIMTSERQTLLRAMFDGIG